MHSFILTTLQHHLLYLLRFSLVWFNLFEIKVHICWHPCRSHKPGMCCSVFLAFKNKKRNVHVLDHCAVQNFTFQLSFTIDAKLNCESSALSAHWVPAWSVSSRRNMNRKRGHDGQTEGQWRECLWAQSLIYKDGELIK